VRPRNRLAQDPLPLDPERRRTGWLVQDAAGAVLYRGTDAELAHEIYHAVPDGDLRLLTDHLPKSPVDLMNRLTRITDAEIGLTYRPRPMS
jgi:hypothetical protein